MTRGARATRGTGGNIVLVALANFAPAVGAVVAAPLLARALGVEGRGELAAAVALYVLMVPIASAGIPEATTFYTARHPEQARRTLRDGVGLLAVSGLVAAAVAVGLTFVLSDPGTLRLLMLVAAVAIVPGVLVTAPRGSSTGLGRWGLVNGEKYLGAGTKLLGFAVLAGLGALTLPAAVLVWVVTPALAGLVYLALRPDPRMPRTRPTPEDEPVGPRRLTSYAGRVSAGSLGGMILARADQVLMVPLAGATQLGLYAAAVNVSDAAAIVNGAVRDVLFSTQSARKDMDLLTRAARSSFAVALVVGTVLLAPVTWWFPLAFGDDFRAAIPSVVAILAGGVLGVPGAVAGAGLSSVGRPGLRSASLGVAAVVNVGLVVALVPPLGALGASLAAFVGSTVASNLNIWFLRRIEGAGFRAFYLVRPDDVRVVLRVARGFLPGGTP